MADTDRGIWVRVNGTYKRVDPSDPEAGIWVRVNGVWKTVEAGWVRVGSSWKQWYPVEDEPIPPPSCPSPGQHTLQATSLSLPSSGSGSATFNTDAYQSSGCIKEIRMRVSWKSFITFAGGIRVSGRPNNNFYRDIDNSGEWSGRTIDHRIDTFDATSLTDFNSGAATGFTFPSLNASSVASQISNVQLVLTT